MTTRATRILFFTNDLCPFAHRATFAWALRPPPSDVTVEFIQIPYTRQIEFADKLGMQSGLVGTSGISLKHNHYAGMDIKDLRDVKRKFMTEINPKGEVPALVLQNSEGQRRVLVESEICAKYFEQASNNSRSLIPKCPLAASRMRLAIEKFSSVTVPMYKLLSNQDVACDIALTTKLKNELGNFVNVLDKKGGFCVGSQSTLADVMSGPVLYRMGIGLRRWRGFDLEEEFSRLKELLETLLAMPEFRKGLVTDAEIAGNYEYVAHGGKWNEDGTALEGRGASDGVSHL